MAYKIGGTTTQDGTPVQATVRIYRRDNGAFLAEAISDPSTGEYLIDTLSYGSECDVLALGGAGVRPMAHGPILPDGSSVYFDDFEARVAGPVGAEYELALNNPGAGGTVSANYELRDGSMKIKILGNYPLALVDLVEPRTQLTITADCDEQTDVNHQPGIALRFIDADNNIFYNPRQASGMQVRTAGVQTNYALISKLGSTEKKYNIRIVIVDDLIQCYIDNVLNYEGTHTEHAEATKVGFGHRQFSGNYHVYFDNILIEWP